MALSMSSHPYSAVDPTLYPSGAPAGPGGSAMSWSAIFGGVVAAIALTLTLVTLGSAFGLASVSPWPGVGAKTSNFTIGAGIWLIVTQWLSALMGGYLAGRLRTRWHGLHTDEVFFRDTAHGFLVWATSTMILAVVAVGAGALANIAAPGADVVMTKEAADVARKTAAAFAAFTGLSLVIGAFIGSLAGTVGGRLRDLHP
jgi:magnesium-transporting ATPase (P-type)